MGNVFIGGLTNEVATFLNHYRSLKRLRQPNVDIHLEPSRAYFRRTIQLAMETAQRELKAARPKDILVNSKGVAYDNYSPRQNLHWALGVARIAEDFELKVDGSPQPWRDLQAKILSLAASSNISLF